MKKQILTGTDAEIARVLLQFAEQVNKEKGLEFLARFGSLVSFQETFEKTEEANQAWFCDWIEEHGSEIDKAILLDQSDVISADGNESEDTLAIFWN